MWFFWNEIIAQNKLLTPLALGCSIFSSLTLDKVVPFVGKTNVRTDANLGLGFALYRLIIQVTQKCSY